MSLLHILAAVFVFMIVVFFHEFGHFAAAKWSGIRVNEFSVGMGPKIWGRQKGETLYSLRALPLGGFCAMEGEDNESESEDSFDHAKPWKRFITIFAGPFMNLVIAVVCFALYAGWTGEPIPTISQVEKNSPMAEAGFQSGDALLALDGAPITSTEELVEALQKGQGAPVRIQAQRGEQQVESSVRPRFEEGRYRLGVYWKTEPNFGYGLRQGWTMTCTLFVQLFDVLGKLFTGQLSLQAVSGPIGVVSAIGQAAEQGAMALLFWTGYLSLNLAFFNLLPIPALDGSKLVLILIEKLRGKPLKKQWEERITLVGFCLLMGLILLVSFKDVINLF